jgi:hypothetical protein
MDKRKRAEFLRTLETVCQPDPRSHYFGIPHDDGVYGGEAFEQHHNGISAFALHSGVPEDIIIQFETAKNIYLYAWFVFRFYPVAQSQAYACLELAMHERLEQEMLAAGWKKREFGFGIRNYLKHAVKKGYIKNEDFEVWRKGVLIRARARYMYESFEEMERLGLTEMEVDESKIEVRDEDKASDYVGVLLKSIPYQRNHYAHGSKTLHKTVLGTFRIVSEIINKLWECKKEESEG